MFAFLFDCSAVSSIQAALLSEILVLFLKYKA